MFSENEVCSLADFQQNAQDYVDRLVETKRPMLLTVNGKAQLVVLDLQAYKEMVEMVDLLDTIKQVNAAAAAFDRGEGRPIEEVFAEMDKRFEEKHGA